MQIPYGNFTNRIWRSRDRSEVLSQAWHSPCSFLERARELRWTSFHCCWGPVNESDGHAAFQKNSWLSCVFGQCQEHLLAH
uniref:Uncharacterized protein n=1 Tax=Vespula pensylvanica TaxID=30213 RepID=A0A834UA54_VESPE|nr:hypothetical protein H0235_007774 [Vespula pensylvanica]